MYNNKIETFSNGELKGHMLYDQGYNLSSSSPTIEGYTVPKANQDGSSPNLGKLSKINVFEGNRMHKVLSLDVPTDYNFSKNFATNFQYQIAKIMGGGFPPTFIENSSSTTEQKTNSIESISSQSSQDNYQSVSSNIVNNNDIYINNNNNFQQNYLKEGEIVTADKSRNVVEKIKQNIESLKIDFIGIEGPVKAKKQIIFEFGPSGGKCLVRYHSIIDSQNCLILVYDTRYEDGVQFLPPSTDDRPIKVYLPDENKTLNVYSLDLTFSLGSLDFIVLIKESA
jgi:hypothetical protein